MALRGADYLIVRGLVRVVRTELDGTETTLRFVRDGDLFGELAVLDGGARSATAIAVRDVVETGELRRRYLAAG